MIQNASFVYYRQNCNSQVDPARSAAQPRLMAQRGSSKVVHIVRQKEEDNAVFKSVERASRVSEVPRIQPDHGIRGLHIRLGGRLDGGAIRAPGYGGAG